MQDPMMDLIFNLCPNSNIGPHTEAPFVKKIISTLFIRKLYINTINVACFYGLFFSLFSPFFILFTAMQDPMMDLLLNLCPNPNIGPHTEAPFVKKTISTLRSKYSPEEIFRWLPSQLNFLANILSGEEESEWHRTYLKGPVATEALNTFQY